MRTLLLAIVIALFGSKAYSQTTDSLVYEFQKIKIVKNLDTNYYTLSNKQSKKTIRKLKFIKRIAHYFQILDKNNTIYYLNEDFERKNTVEDYFGVCGTVPHYTLSIIESKDDFIIMGDETFYDSGNKIPAKKTLTISKKEADHVFFINGKSEFKYTENFGVGGTTVINPTTVIIEKDGKYSFYGTKQKVYDSVSFNAYYPSIKTEKNKLFGYYTIVEPSYTKIGNFVYYLAKVQFVDGTDGFIDIEGNAYK